MKTHKPSGPITARSMLAQLQDHKGKWWIYSRPTYENWRALKELEAKGKVTCKEVGTCGGIFYFELVR